MPVTSAGEPPVDVPGGARLEISGNGAVRVEATASLTVAAASAVASAFVGGATLEISGKDGGSAVEQEEVVRTAASVVKDEANRLAGILSVLDEQTIDDLIHLGLAAAEIAGQGKSDEERIGELQYLLLQEEHNRTISASLEQLTSDVGELRSLVEQGLPAARLPHSDLGLDKEAARIWLASTIIYLSAALVAGIGLGALLAGNHSGAGDSGLLFTFLLGLRQAIGDLFE